MKLHELKEAFAERSLRHSLSCIEKGDLQALAALEALGLDKVPKEKRRVVAEAFYSQAKVLLGKAAFEEAIGSLKLAHTLQPENHLLAERVSLLQRTEAHCAPVRRRLSLQNLQRDLAVPCNKRRCECNSHFQIAICQGVIEDSFVHKHTIHGVIIYTVGPYHSRSHAGKWTKLLKAVKHAPFKAEPLKPMADILADFIVEKTPLLGLVDVIVPVPPSPAKFAERGFAPNDIVSERLGGRLALPVRKALVRKDGISTKEASDAQLAGQFEVRQSEGRRLAGLSVLLVEDIWTAGRTIPICAGKLRTFGPKNVYAVALGRTRG